MSCLRVTQGLSQSDQDDPGPRKRTHAAIVLILIRD
jgi:hypothetical protein